MVDYKNFLAVLPDGREITVQAVSAFAAGIAVMQALGVQHEPREVKEL